MANSIPYSIRQLSNRYKTNASLTRKGSHEFHDLSSLSQRLMLSPAETLNTVSQGRLLSLDELNGKHLFSSSSLDNIRNQVIDFISASIVKEMSERGYGEDSMLLAFEKALTKQYHLSRSDASNLIEFDQSDDDSFSNRAKRAAGTVAGVGAAGAAGYGLYRGYKYLNGGGNNGGNPPLGYGSGSPNPLLPPNSPNSANGVQVGIEAHPQPKVDMLTTASPTTPKPAVRIPASAEGSLLTQAARRGKGVIGKAGSALFRALRSIPIE